MRGVVVGTVLAVGLTLVGCGKKGPPLAPIPVLPEGQPEVRAVQWGEEVVLIVRPPLRYRDGLAYVPAVAEALVLTADRVPGLSAARETSTPVPLASFNANVRGRFDPHPLGGPGISEPAAKGEGPAGAAPAGQPGAAGGEGEEGAVSENGAVSGEAAGGEAAPGSFVGPPARPAASPAPGPGVAPVAGRAPAPTPAGLSPEAMRRAAIEGALRSRFADAARTVAEVKAAPAGGPLVIRLPLNTVGAGLAAVGVRLRGDRKGDRGSLSSAVLFEAGTAPAAPAAPEIVNLEDGIHIRTGAAPGSPVAVYRAPAADAPPSPYTLGGGPTDRAELVDADLPLGATGCYALAAVVAGRTDVRSVPSPLSCVVREDRFAPPAPDGLQGFASGEGVTLTWSAVVAPDLAGYVVLRREPGSDWTALTAAPIAGTSYIDTSGVRGRTYEYSVRASDKATPPNLSGPAPPVRERIR